MSLLYKILSSLPPTLILFLSAAPALAASATMLNRLTNAATNMGYTPIGDVAPQTKIAQILGLILNYLLGFLGVIFMILMIYAGILWMMAHGNEQQVTEAKQTLKHATIGLVIVVIAYAAVISVGYIIKATGLFKAGG